MQLHIPLMSSTVPLQQQKVLRFREVQELHATKTGNKRAKNNQHFIPVIFAGVNSTAVN